MKYKAFFVLLALIIFSTAVLAQADKIGSVSGQVTEKVTGRPIEGAVVSADGVEAKTDASGRYKIEVPAGTYNLRVRAEKFSEYLSGQITVTSSRTFVQDFALTIALDQVTVEVAASTFEPTTDQPVSQTVFNRDEIRNQPGSGGDPLRAINSLPAVTVQSGEFADLIVRGGSSGENLTFIDNIPISDFTLFTDKYDQGRSGRATFLPPDVFSSVDFSAGGFGVKYGDKMSSVLDVKLREPNKEKLQGSVFVDSGGAGLSLDTPIGKKGGLLTSIRRSYIDVAFDLFDVADIGRPRNWDIINRGTYEIDGRNKLSFTTINLFEKYTLSDDQAVGSDRSYDRLRTERRSRRGIFGLTWSSTIGDSTLSQATFWGNIRRQDGGFFRPRSVVVQRTRDLRESEFGIKEELTSSLRNNLQLSAGGALIINRADYFSFEKSGAGFSALEEESLSPDRTSRFDIGTKTSAYAYGQLTWRPSDRLSVSPQLRVDRLGITGETVVSPRFNARYSISDSVSVNFATGLYYQVPDLFTFTISSNRSLKAQKATHIVGGIEWLASPDVRIRAEVFRKDYSRLAVRPFGNISSFGNTGEGTAEGMEFSLQKSLSGMFAGQISYSYVKSRRGLCEGCFTFPADVERPHQLILLGITRMWGFTIGGKYRLASGLPYSVRTPVTIAPGSYLHRLARVEDVNSKRLGKFSVLDMRIEKKFDFKRWSIAPFFDLFNVFAANEGTEVTYELNRRTPRIMNEGTRLPIIGLRMEF